MCVQCSRVGIGPHSTSSQLEAAVAQGEQVLAMATERGWQYRRPLTELEERYGDVERVRADHDKAEQAIAKAAGPLVRKIAKQLAAEAAAVIEAGNPTGLAKLQPSYTAELAGVLLQGLRGAVRSGKAQVLDSYQAQTGTQLAVRKRPARKDVRKAAIHLQARAEVDAELIAGSVARTMKQAVVAGLGRAASATEYARQLLVPGDGNSALTEAILAGERSLVAVAMAEAREGIGLGRLYGFDEVREYVEVVAYTAILDTNVCEVCAPMDGQEYGPDEFGKAPNDGCLGGDRCRCFEVLVFRDRQ